MLIDLDGQLYASNIESLDPCKDNNDINCSGNTAKIVSSLDTLRVLGILIFGFTCHQVHLTFFMLLCRYNLHSIPRIYLQSKMK